MTGGAPVALSAAVEGVVDEAVLKRLAADASLALGSVYGRRGKSHLLRQLAEYNNAARYGHWLVLLDLDHDADCAPDLAARCLPQPAPHMHLRIAVREVEAWLLADRAAIAAFLGVPVAKVPARPEAMDDPKRAVVDLAVQSRRRAIQRDLVPRSGSGREVGSLYTTRMVEFARDHWRPEVAAAECDSLRRCIAALQSISRSTP